MLRRHLRPLLLGTGFSCDGTGLGSEGQSCPPRASSTCWCDRDRGASLRSVRGSAPYESVAANLLAAGAFGFGLPQPAPPRHTGSPGLAPLIHFTQTEALAR